MRDSPDLRAALIATMRRIAAADLTRNTSGNLSHRVDDGLVVTPTGMAYDRLRPEDLVFIDAEGRSHGTRAPSSEWRFHHDILAARPEVSVVLHGHPPFATSIACLREGIPPFHYMIAAAGGADIRCADYATYGTAALSANAVAALAGRKACLLANHGFIVLGADFDDALTRAIEVETLAEMYWRARQIGTPVLLDAAEMAVVLAKYATYGGQPERGGA